MYIKFFYQVLCFYMASKSYVKVNYYIVFLI